MAHRGLPIDAPSPRLCLVKKTAQDRDGYGFTLHAQRNKSQFIGAVDVGSPADRGGLRQGDCILGVNGALIANESHKDVVQRIKSQPNQCELLVIDETGLKWYENQGIAPSYELSNIIRPAEDKEQRVPQPDNQTYVSTARLELRPQQQKHENVEEEEQNNTIRSIVPERRNTGASVTIGQPNIIVKPAPLMSPRPLLCHLRKQKPTDEFGFNLHAERNKGHFIGAVDQGGIADVAGLETGQRIVGVNGELVYPNSLHKEVVALIKRDLLDTRLLVASEEVDRWYTENGIPYSFDLAIVHESARQPVPQSRTATVTSTLPQSRHDSIMYERSNPQPSTFYTIHDEVATDAVYVPPELQPTVEEEIIVEQQPTAPPDSASEAVEDFQDLERAAVSMDTADDLLDQVFGRVKPPEVEAADLREQNGFADALSDAQVVAPVVVEYSEHESKHLITNYNSTVPLTVSPPHSTTSSSHHPPPVTYTPASQFGTGLGSPHSDKRSLDSPDSHKDENVDIFKLSAKEARQMMRHRRKDPRLQANMTLEEKHQLIANL